MVLQTPQSKKIVATEHSNSAPPRSNDIASTVLQKREHNIFNNEDAHVVTPYQFGTQHQPLLNKSDDVLKETQENLENIDELIRKRREKLALLKSANKNKISENVLSVSEKSKQRIKELSLIHI